MLAHQIIQMMDSVAGKVGPIIIGVHVLTDEKLPGPSLSSGASEVDQGKQRLANRQDRSIQVSKVQSHTNYSQKAVLNFPKLCLESSLMRRPHRRAVFKSGSYEKGIQHFECRSASHASGRSKKETKISLGSLAHIKYMLLRAKIIGAAFQDFILQCVGKENRSLYDEMSHICTFYVQGHGVEPTPPEHPVETFLEQHTIFNQRMLQNVVDENKKEYRPKVRSLRNSRRGRKLRGKAVRESDLELTIIKVTSEPTE
ncbi:hypothetical protein J6590_093887 [Homalodisca vitripennis]|nr:hypothetical protein J6590_021740 [Homalodisca vitripennis]KAG8334292.1 hypothetical protein J6590_093887 [Homalodisca vitripennis]